MKKKILIILAIILVIIAVATIYYFTPKTFVKNVNPMDVDHIEVFDGSTGNGFTVDNPEYIKYIVENIQSHPMKRTGVSVGYMGYTFKISFIDSNDKDIVPVFILNSNKLIRKDPFFYECDGGLCYNYLKNLEQEYFSEIKRQDIAGENQAPKE